MIEAIEEILEVNGAVPELVLLTSQPIEISEEARDQEEDDKGAKEDDKKEVEDTNLSANFNPEAQVDWLTYLSKKGEQIDDTAWEMIHAVIDDEETEDEDWEAMLTEQVNLSMPELASAPADNRAGVSAQDTKFLKVRYAYVQGSKKNGSSKGKKQRAFCTAMESASRLYRKEDIIKMQSDGVNSELGHNKQPYSIWKHKGGVNCHHKFERRIYLKRTKADGTAWGGGAMNGVRKITVGQAKKLGFDPKRNKFRNDKRVAEAQIDRADKGHHPSYSAPKK
jgi:hypothetical protein